MRSTLLPALLPLCAAPDLFQSAAQRAATYGKFFQASATGEIGSAWRKTDDGSDVIGLKGFNYSQYLAKQLSKFEPKTERFITADGRFNESFEWVYYKDALAGNGGVSVDSIGRVARYVQAKVGLKSNFALCHGVNHGHEITWFKKHLPTVTVVGTELGPLTAKLAPSTVNWDFHVVKPEWRQACDFVYSNAIDHSPNPPLAVTRWMEEIRPGGALVLEWSSFSDSRSKSATDLYGASLHSFQAMVNKAGKAASPPFAKADLFNNSEDLGAITSARRKTMSTRYWIVVRRSGEAPDLGR